MRSPTRHTAALVASVFAAAPAAARAQLPNPLGAPGPRAGILAGLSSATFGGSDTQLDASDTQAGVAKKRRNGFVAGGYLTFPVAPGLPIALRPELLYAQKGVRFTSSYYPPTVEPLPSNAQGTVTGTSKLDYLELPVLLQLEIPNTAGLRPSLYAGPSLAYLLRCRAETEAGGTTTSEDCTSGENSPRRFDASGVVGGQLGFALAGQAIGVGVRYTHGFTSLAKDASVKNRAFAVYGAVEFGR